MDRDNVRVSRKETYFFTVSGTELTSYEYQNADLTEETKVVWEAMLKYPFELKSLEGLQELNGYITEKEIYTAIHELIDKGYCIELDEGLYVSNEKNDLERFINNDFEYLNPYENRQFLLSSFNTLDITEAGLLTKIKLLGPSKGHPLLESLMLFSSTPKEVVKKAFEGLVKKHVFYIQDFHINGEKIKTHYILAK